MTGNLRTYGKGVCILLWSFTVIGLILASTLAEGSSSKRVELICTLSLPDEYWGNRPWDVRLYGASGEVAGLAQGRTGESIRFRNLERGTYLVCVCRRETFERCESADLTSAGALKSNRYWRELRNAPVLRRDRNLVSLSEISVPKKAVDEMRKAIAASINGDNEKYREYLEKAVETYPHFSKALNNLGVYWLRKDLDKAIEYFRRAAEADPGYHLALNNLAAGLCLTGKADAALDVSRKALEINPDDPRSNATVALAYYRLGRYDDAERYLKKLLAVDPENALHPQLYLFHIALQRGNGADAEENLRGFLLVHPDFPDAGVYKGALEKVVSKTSNAFLLK